LPSIVIASFKGVSSEISEDTILEEKTRTGKPCGDEDFYEKIKEITGIDYRNKKTGPKSKNENN
jgi:hypothetical protein